jgi:hypothetical protein
MNGIRMDSWLVDCGHKSSVSAGFGEGGETAIQRSTFPPPLFIHNMISSKQAVLDK